MKSEEFLLELIREGEHIGQDFKQTVNNFHKIAKTLVAFANTQGGRLLIGVKDNGKISGINPQEELYMIDYAAKKLSIPEIKYFFDVHSYKNKQVLEIIVPESIQKPHYALDTDKQKKVFIRVKDNTRLATKTMVEVMKASRPTSKPLRFRYAETEEKIIRLLRKYPKLTLFEIAEKLNIPYYRIRRILVVLIVMNVVGTETGMTQDYYYLKPEIPE